MLNLSIIFLEKVNSFFTDEDQPTYPQIYRSMSQRRTLRKPISM